MISGFFIAGAATLLAYHLGMRYVLTYRLTDTSVQAVLFGVLPVSSTRYDRIESVEISPLIAFLALTTWRTNRLAGQFILIRRDGIPVAISPDAPKEFARELSIRVQERTGEWPLVS